MAPGDFPATASVAAYTPLPPGRHAPTSVRMLGACSSIACTSVCFLETTIRDCHAVLHTCDLIYNCSHVLLVGADHDIRPARSSTDISACCRAKLAHQTALHHTKKAPTPAAACTHTHGQSTYPVTRYFIAADPMGVAECNRLARAAGQEAGAPHPSRSSSSFCSLRRTTLIVFTPARLAMPIIMRPAGAQAS